MTQPAGHQNEVVRRFHRMVAEGIVDELQAALKQGAEVNAPGHVGMTALMVAMGARDFAKAKLLIEHGADLELTDDFNATALRHAVKADFGDGVRLFLDLGADRGYYPRYPLKKNPFYGQLPDVEMPVGLRELMPEAEWKASLEESRKWARELGENPKVEPIISDVQSVEVLKLFLEVGDDLNLAPKEVKRALLGMENGGELRVTASEYRRHKSPCFGRSNPESMDFPLWREMVRTGVHAYAARTQFNDQDPFTNPGAVWCFDRFGSSLTELGDGRYVQIGGEHEDHYDPDFYIYNDVVIHDGHGDFKIFGYPRDVFPPTDFHTATLCGDYIFIVGCIGYVDQRQPGFTPVYRLKLETWEIEAVVTVGEMPGWIHRHRARHEPADNAIFVEGGEVHVVTEDGEHQLIPNERQFALQLDRLEWRRLN